MSWTRSDGGQVCTPRNETKRADAKERAKAVAMAALKDQGWSYREIGAFFGIKHMEIVRRIISRVPAEARGMRGTAKLVG